MLCDLQNKYFSVRAFTFVLKSDKEEWTQSLENITA